MENTTTKKGRKSKRDSNRTETIIMRVTPEEKQLIKKFHQDLTRYSRISLTDFIINCVYANTLTKSIRTPIDEIHKLAVPEKRRK